MKPIRNKQFAWIALVVILSLALPWAAFADNLFADGDGVAPVANNNSIDLGDICLDESVIRTVLLAVERRAAANAATVYANSATLTVSAGSPTDTDISVLMVTDSITLPAGWTASAFGTMSSSVQSAVTVEGGLPTGSRSGDIEYSAQGAANGGGDLTRSVVLTVSWNVIDCAPADETSPTASPTQDPAANSNGWNNTDVTITWNWADEDGGSGIDPNNCTMTTVATAEGQYDVTATCFDLAGNEGTASYPVKIDKTAPTASPTQSPAANANGWNNTDVTITWNWSDGSGSGLDNCTVSTVASAEGQYSVMDTCYDLAGNSYQASNAVEIDKTDPTVSAAVTPAAAGTGWWNIATGAPTVTFTCADALSEIASCTAPYTFPEGADQSYIGTAVDNADNTASATVEDIDVDLTAPGIIWSNGPQDGESYYFGFVPAEPTCTATDALSGPDGCAVTGYGTTVGSHTLTATAYDEAGNETVETRTYTVLAWTLTGFYQPVSMDALNTVKGGSTVPLKFNVYAGDLELTDVALVSFSAAPYTCGGSLPEDPVTMTTTGNTSLRYDFTDGQFIQNWKTPKSPGKCYLVTMTTSDGSKLEANFKLK